MLYSSVSPTVQNNVDYKTYKQTEDITIVDGVALESAPVSAKNNVEIIVREYFEDTPILAEIAKCESQFRQIGSSGNIIRGKVNKSDIGVMQINTYYHAKQAEKLGLDLNTLLGNMAYGKVLYEKEGTAPWISSSPCWNKYVAMNRK